MKFFRILYLMEIKLIKVLNFNNRMSYMEIINKNKKIFNKVIKDNKYFLKMIKMKIKIKILKNYMTI
jgi:hypothetical protein